LEISGVKRLAKDKLILEGSLKVSGVKMLIKEKLILKDILEKMKL
jgi:hypothetical protein